MAYPVFEDATGISYAVANNQSVGIDVSYLGTINSNDILVLFLMGKASGSYAWNTPSGFTHIASETGTFFSGVYWKRATGSESGTINCKGTRNATINQYGIMYRFSGCVTSGSAVEGGSANTEGSTSTVNIQDLASDTTGVERLCCSIAAGDNDRAANDNATNYSEADDQQTGSGTDTTHQLYTYQQAIAGKPGADSYTLIAPLSWHQTTFALLPVALGYANDVVGVASASIGEVNGVATADIAKVVGS